MPLPNIFLSLADLFESYGYTLYMVGGSSRDYLLKREVSDFDFVTDATPEEMKIFLPDLKDPFAHLGSVYVHRDGYRVDITTFRKEEEYEDHRHPTIVSFVKTPNEEYRRRDFTINALYIDKYEKIFDFSSGLKDLRYGIIRTIGNPYIRIVEDPLRILRALRFSLLLNFEIEEHLKKVIKENIFLLKELTPAKVNLEIKKMMMIDEEATLKLLKEFRISKSY